MSIDMSNILRVAQGGLRESWRAFKSNFVAVEPPYADVAVEYKRQGEGTWVAIARDSNGNVVKVTTILVGKAESEEQVVTTAVH